VSAGKIYRIRVEESFAVWDYHFNDPFVVKLSIE
jgi:hypothetical protein